MDEMKNMNMVKFADVSGINLPFVLYIPDGINEKSNLILNGITPSAGTQDAFNNDRKNFETYSDSLKEATVVATNNYFSPAFKKLATDFNNAMLIPIIPRSSELYTSFLGYDIYHENFERAIEEYNKGNSKFSAADLDKFRKLDVQISDMIKYSLNYIKDNYNLQLDEKVIATGYSASSKMVNFFSALHPDQVKMIIAGGVGGLCILPLTNYKNKDLNYPLGFNDLPPENLEAFKSIPQFYYVGKDDQNAPHFLRSEYEKEYDKSGNEVYKRDNLGNRVLKKIDGKFALILDQNGEPILAPGGYYSKEQAEFIYNDLSCDVQKRFDMDEAIYKSCGVNATFKKYNGDHIIEDENLEKDILDFYTKNIDIQKKEEISNIGINK